MAEIVLNADAMPFIRALMNDKQRLGPAAAYHLNGVLSAASESMDIQGIIEFVALALFAPGQLSPSVRARINEATELYKLGVSGRMRYGIRILSALQQALAERGDPELRQVALVADALPLRVVQFDRQAPGKSWIPVDPLDPVCLNLPAPLVGKRSHEFGQLT